MFTSHDSYHNPVDPAGNRKDAAMVTIYLVRNGKCDIHVHPHNYTLSSDLFP